MIKSKADPLNTGKCYTITVNSYIFHTMEDEPIDAKKFMPKFDMNLNAKVIFHNYFTHIQNCYSSEIIYCNFTRYLFFRLNDVWRVSGHLHLLIIPG